MWLENNLFLSVHHTTSSQQSSVYHIITRSPPSSFKFQRIADPVEAFGSEKEPHRSILRLRDFPPGLSDLLIISSTASTEIGLLSRSENPLAIDKPAEAITNVFTTTELLDDTKRPTLPMTDDMDDSTPIGFALDLSSRDKVYKPIPAEEELEETQGPLPGLWVLTHEGVLCPWWIVYTSSVKAGTTYPGLAAVDKLAASSASVPGNGPSSGPFAKPSGPAFGTSTAPQPAFGSSSQLGHNSSPWGSADAQSPQSGSGGAVFGSANIDTKPSPFGSQASATSFAGTGQNSPFGSAASSSSPAFGKPSAIGFGQSAQLGMRSSPWSAIGNSAPAFGQTGFASAPKNETKSPFWNPADGSKTSDAPSAGGFAGFAKQGGFASLSEKAADSQGSASPFATADSKFGTGGSVFGNGINTSNSPFGSATGASASTNTMFEPQEQRSSGGPFGSEPFKLQSSFKPDPSSQADATQSKDSQGVSMMDGFGSALEATNEQPGVVTTPPRNASMSETVERTEETPRAGVQGLYPSREAPESTTPTTSPNPPKFGLGSWSTPGTSLGSPPTNLESSTTPSLGARQQSSRLSPFSNIYQNQTSLESGKYDEPETPKIKEEDEDAPLPPDTTSRLAYPIGESSSSSAASTAPRQFDTATTSAAKEEPAPLPPAFTAKPKSSISGSKEASHSTDRPNETEDAPLPPDPVRQRRPAVPEKTSPAIDQSLFRPSIDKAGSSLSYEFVPPQAPSKEFSNIPSIPDSGDDSDLGEDNATEGSGVDVAQDLSPSESGLTRTSGFSPETSFGGGEASTAPATGRLQQSRQRPLFGEVGRNAPVFSRPQEQSPRSPSPIRSAVPNRMLRSEATRSVSAPGMASQILGVRQSRSPKDAPFVDREGQFAGASSFMAQHKKLRERQEAEESRPLVDEEDDDIQELIASEVEGTLMLDEFIAHSNAAPPAEDSVPAQVEAVYRDINSMIDTLGLNARAVKSFTKGHMEHAKEGGRTDEDLEIPDDWVLCEIGELGDVLDRELYPRLEDGRVRDLEEKLDICHELARDMHRLRARQEDLRRTMTARMDGSQAEVVRSMPLSAEQSAQQNELRRDFGNFAKLLSEAEEALTLLKTKIAFLSSSSGKAGAAVPTVDAVIRTITKMTGMVEKRSGDIDVLETQLRGLRLGSGSREASPMLTPQGRRTSVFSPDRTPASTMRQSLSSSVFGSPGKDTPPRRKLSGFSQEEKSELMARRARRQAVLDKLNENVVNRGVHVWNMEDID